MKTHFVQLIRATLDASLLPTRQVEVSDVLAEPASPRSLDQVWFYSVLGFEKARVCTYQVLSLLLAVPFAFLCGVFLATLACLHVWYVWFWQADGIENESFWVQNRLKFGLIL